MRHDPADGRAFQAISGPPELPVPIDPASGDGRHDHPSSTRGWCVPLATDLFKDRVPDLAKVHSGLAIPVEADWTVAGDTAFDIALRTTKGTDAPADRVDIATTALLRPALAGNTTVALVRSSGLPVPTGLAAGWNEPGRLPPDPPSRSRSPINSANERG